MGFMSSTIVGFSFCLGRWPLFWGGGSGRAERGWAAGVHAMIMSKS